MLLIMKKSTLILTTILLTLLHFSCKKWTDPAPYDDPQVQERKYCNDPEAVNYNWDFPGIADSTTCIFPADLYTGTYTFTDSIYFDDETTLDTDLVFQTYTLQIIRNAKSKFSIQGFCSSNELTFTAGRSTYQASADTTLKQDDSTYAYGQPLCSIQDTLTGTVTKSTTDTTGKTITISWEVVSDTGINYHKGTAIKL